MLSRLGVAVVLAGLVSLPGVQPCARAQAVPVTAPVTASPSPPREATGAFVPSRSLGTTRDTEPPRYVVPLAATGLQGTAGIDWLQVGADYRVRIESRADDLRRERGVYDRPVLLRTRAYLGLTRVLDPLRLAVEVEDARRHDSRFAPDGRDVNTVEPIQLIAELHLANGLGRDRPFSVKAGRFAFETGDRRLVSRNEWRNTTNTFQGVRVQFGTERDVWSAEVLALQPLARRLSALDEVVEGQWLTGVHGGWRRWSRQVTFEPYYLRLTERPARAPSRDVHAVGLRAYGPAGTTGLDYDASVHLQRGRAGTAPHRAWAGHAEVGYTAAHGWRPRIAAFYGYISGDRRPDDGRVERFERFFGFGRVWSSHDYFQMENLSAPRIGVEFMPRRRLAIDAAYEAFWLASARDRWAPGLIHDPRGAAGRFVGHELNVRGRYPVAPHLSATLGYAYFAPGAVPRRAGKPDASHFAYVEMTVNAFR